MRATLLFALILLFVLASGTVAAPQRVVGPVRHWTGDDLARFKDSVVDLKLVEGTNSQIGSGRFSVPGDLAILNGVLDRAGAFDLEPMFRVDRATARSWKAMAEARSGKAGPDLSLWYTFRVPGGAAALARVLNEVNDLSCVEIAHPEAIAEPASIVSSALAAAPIDGGGGERTTPDFTAQQGYLYNPPVGLNAPAAWAIPGGTAAGEKFIDVELAWTENHEDFPFDRCFYIGGAPQSNDPAYEKHGTAVMGEVVGQRNGFGIDGFAHGLDGFGVVAIDINAYPSVATWFQEAVDHLSPGDVWLIELQMYPPGRSATPMEWLQSNYDVIWTSAWARNIICIEAGANGSQDLDSSIWGGIFDRNVRDSGAIMVAAGTPTGLVAEWFTNYGSRMDVHAWGSQIVSTGYGDLYNGGSLQTRYTNTFGGTSGASPMVAGSALCLQGIARVAAGTPLAPTVIRGILHDTGTPFQGTQYIGPRPNLSAAAQALLEMAASVSGEEAVIRPRIVAEPNPFSSGTTLRYSPVRPGSERAWIADASGRKIRGFEVSAGSAGERLLHWDGRNDEGAPVASGVYFLRVQAPGVEGELKLQKIR